MTNDKYCQRGSKASLEVWLGWIPAGDRSAYHLVHIAGDEYGIVFKETSSWLKSQLKRVPDGVLVVALDSYIEKDVEKTDWRDQAIGALEDNLHDMCKEDAIDQLASIIGIIGQRVLDWELP